jgi:hypothetical protein
MFRTSHFSTEREAWTALLGSAEASVSLAGTRVKEARRELLAAQEQAGYAAERFAAVRDGLESFREREGSS